MWASMKAEDGELVVHEGKPSLEDLQKAVGGYVEAFDVLGDTTTMWCNEESKLTAEPVPNPKATWLMQRENGGPGMFRGDYIAGDVAFTGAPDEEGESTDLTEAAAFAIREAKRLYLMGQIDDPQEGDLVELVVPISFS